MISDLPAVKIPETIAKLCSIRMANSRSVFNQIAQVIESDRFLNLYVKKTFAQYLDNGGMLRMLTTLGCEGFRNRICEAYIYHARFGRYPEEIELDEIYDVLDIEKRFNFLFSEGHNHVFKLGFFLKLCDIFLENHHEVANSEFISIPLDVDEILIKGQSRSSEPDWLIIIIWSLVNILGDEQAMSAISSTRGDWNKILIDLSLSQKDEFYSSLLKYGHGVSDSSFFLGSKV